MHSDTLLISIFKMKLEESLKFEFTTVDFPETYPKSSYMLGIFWSNIYSGLISSSVHSYTELFRAITNLQYEV